MITNQEFGQVPTSVGFNKADGIVSSKDAYYNELISKGYTVSKTKNGVIVTPPKTSRYENNKLIAEFMGIKFKDDELYLKE